MEALRGKMEPWTWPQDPGGGAIAMVAGVAGFWRPPHFQPSSDFDSSPPKTGLKAAGCRRKTANRRFL
jgi:hypothetical protein